MNDDRIGLRRHLVYDDPRIVMARRTSQSDCREDAYADGSVYELRAVKSYAEFCAVRSICEITADCCDGGEIMDIWMEDAP
jgi:hypothetical protein